MTGGRDTRERASNRKEEENHERNDHSSKKKAVSRREGGSTVSDIVSRPENVGEVNLFRFGKKDNTSYSGKRSFEIEDRENQTVNYLIFH